MNKVRTRFAPSPTGYLHVGGLRTIIYAYIIAKQNKGEFLLRIEDTDKEREVPGAKEALIQTITNMGFDYDEGPILKEGKLESKGKYGPYIQSQRLEIYQKYVKQLLDQGQAYYCFCTPERLTQMREEQMKNNHPPKYDRTCCNLSAEEIRANLDNKKPHVIRMKIPDNATITFNDLVKGEVSFNSNDSDDQVLLKADGYPTYHLAVVVDDHLMGISHVIRGDEWLASTPKHLILYKYFGWDATIFAHMALLLNPDRTKLSKRKGDVAVEDFLRQGYLKEALINFVATIGWSEEAGSEQEIYSLDDLIKKFDIKRLTKAGAIFNLEKLDWLNGHYIRAKKVKDLTKLCLPFLKQIKADIPEQLAEKIVTIEQERLKKLSDITKNLNFLVINELNYQPELLVWKKSSPEKAKENLIKLENFLSGFKESDFKTIKSLESLIMTWIKDNAYGTGDMLWPMRVALSGQQNSPSPFEIAWIIGKNATINRIKDAIDKLN